jgi:hypothetical protein
MDTDSFRIYPEQQAMIYFFTLKGLKSRVIHTELESSCGSELLALPTVKKWRRHFHQGRTDLFDDPKSERPVTNELAGAIRSILEKRSFSSCKVLCRHFRIEKAICLRILHDKLGLKPFHLRWVPHALLMSQKSRKDLSNVITEISARAD